MVLISSTAEHPPQIARRVGPFIPIRGSSVLSRRTVSTHDGSLGRDPASNAPANSRRAMCVAISQSRWAPVELMITGRPRQPPLWVGRVKPRCGTGPSEASASRPSQSRPGRLGRGDGVLHTGSHIRCRRVQGGATSEGIHLAAMAGSVDLVQRCFTGPESRADRIMLSPDWPESLDTLAFPIRYRDHRPRLRDRRHERGHQRRSTRQAAGRSRMFAAAYNGSCPHTLSDSPGRQLK